MGNSPSRRSRRSRRETEENVCERCKNQRVYCGNDDELPEDYDRFGTRYECLRTGIGVGVFGIGEESRQKMLKKSKNNPRELRNLSRDELVRMADRLRVNTLTETGRKRSKKVILKDVIRELENLERRDE